MKKLYGRTDCTISLAWLILAIQAYGQFTLRSVTDGQEVLSSERWRHARSGDLTPFLQFSLQWQDES